MEKYILIKGAEDCEGCLFDVDGECTTAMTCIISNEPYIIINNPLFILKEL